jgi:hypothetical protein
VIRELMRLFREAKAAGAPSTSGRDPLALGRVALRPAIALALQYTAEQGLLPHRMQVEDVWEGLPAGLDRELD